MEQVNFEFAVSPVFGPGSSGTFEVTVRGGAHVRRAVLHPGPRGWPPARHPAPDVRRVPGRRQLTSTASRPGTADTVPGRDVPVPAPPALDRLHGGRRGGHRRDGQPRVLATASPRRTASVQRRRRGADRRSRRSRSTSSCRRMPRSATTSSPPSSGDRSRRPGATCRTRSSCVVNRSQGGRAGDNVVTPLLLDDGRVLLVARGFVPLDNEWSPAPTGDVTIEGRLRRSEVTTDRGVVRRRRRRARPSPNGSTFRGSLPSFPATSCRCTSS